MRENIMPQAIDTEKSILSMASVSPDDIMSRAIRDGVNEDFFYLPAHKILWSVFYERFSKGLSLDAVSVTQELEDKNLLKDIGGTSGVMEVFSFPAIPALYDQYFSVLKEKHVRRKIILRAIEIEKDGFNSNINTDVLVDALDKDAVDIRNAFSAGEHWSLKKDLKKVVDNMEDLLKGKGAMFGCKTGFPKLDTLTNGLKAGELFVVAARPSMGKTAFLLNMAESILFISKKPVLLFSLEMTSVQLIERLLFAKAGVSKSQIIKNNGITQVDIRKIMRAVAEMQKSDLVIDDTPAISFSKLRAKAIEVKKQLPDLAVIGIDYLQLVRSSSKQAMASREREIAEISGNLKQLAKELSVPIIVLAQLNRGPENRTGKNKGVPMMSDLRESGAIEQDADMVGLLYRKKYYAEDENEKEEVGDDAELILAKNRNGETGIVPLSFRAELMKFEQREHNDYNEQ